MLVCKDRQIWRKTLGCLFAIALSCILLVGCSDRIESGLPAFKSPGGSKIKVSEVAPSVLLQQLRAELDRYQPQVELLSPKPNEILNDTTATVKLQVRDLPVFKNAEFDAGPHLALILDNHPSQAVYTPDEAIIFNDLEPGTHTLRLVAVTPWDETFKNEGAFAQTTFHILTPTGSNAPDPAKPLLTYSSPQGNYGAEPIPIDFYLSSVPLHIVAAENPDDDIKDWRIRITVNGQSFITDTWQPIYLKGFQTGKNWVKLEFLDEDGNVLDNAFNSTVRSLDYQPNAQSLFAQLTRGELSLADSLGLVDPNYIKPVPAPIVEEAPPPVLEEPPVVEEVPPPVLEEPPVVEEVPPITPVEPEIDIIPPPEIEASPIIIPELIPAEPEVIPAPAPETPTVEVIPVPTVLQPEVKVIPAPAPETPAVEVIPVPTVLQPEVKVIPAPALETPAVEVIPVPTVLQPEVKVIPAPALETPTVEVLPVPTVLQPEVKVVPTTPLEPSVAADKPSVEVPVTATPATPQSNKVLDQLKSRFNRFQNLVKGGSP